MSPSRRWRVRSPGPHDPPVFEAGRRPLRQHLPGRSCRWSDSNRRPLTPERNTRSRRARRDHAHSQIQTDDWGFARQSRTESVLRPRSGNDAAIGHICWRSLQLSRCYLGDTNQGICANERLALAGANGIEPCLRRVWLLPGYRCPAPSCASCVLSVAPEIKRAAPLRKRLERL
jgi:hypothetical protein